jgi:hypothetical protein
LFNDPDGDALAYEVSCDQAALTFEIQGNDLMVHAVSAFEGESQVTVLASDGEFETSLSFKVSSSIVGLSPDQSPEAFRFYPNPVSDILHVEINMISGYTGPVTVEVFNMAGKSVITHQNGRVDRGAGRISLDMSGEPAGYYILKLGAGDDLRSFPINKR